TRGDEAGAYAPRLRPAADPCGVGFGRCAVGSAGWCGAPNHCTAPGPALCSPGAVAGWTWAYPAGGPRRRCGGGPSAPAHGPRPAERGSPPTVGLGRVEEFASHVASVPPRIGSPGELETAGSAGGYTGVPVGRGAAAGPGSGAGTPGYAGYAG